ncbi:MAG: aminomethyl-transferring glycine dehydrogenase subunit GcvPB [Candidatus Riflebacteria bacterium]|nr:aminomethyl-transferring glycine dehydrogenase subunit GcvPB [Candidatus Riflebacteria bacterium]
MKTASVLDRSRQGFGGAAVFDPEFPDVAGTEWFPADEVRTAPIGLPELSELEVVRHFTGLSHGVHGVDSGPYPLGSCTMKYNPKRNDALARLDGFARAHPRQPADTLQGLWDLSLDLQRFIAELTGMDAVSLQPAAGAHGELAGLLIMRKYFAERGEPRRIILIPDSAHGTNPASAAMVGYECKIIPTTPDGLMDLAAMDRLLDRNVAGLMLTNPSTLGLFEENITRIGQRVHDQGALLYYDGANLNALMGIVRPGDMGFDLVHINVHKTLSTPHGGGGPGAGPVGVKAFLEPYLPVPVIRRVAGRAVPDHDRPSTIGKIKTHFGHTEVLVKAYCYVLTVGALGLKTATENAVLNANYLQAKLADLLPPVFHERCMHECLLSGGTLKVSPFDFVKRLIDFGVHPPTLVGAGCVHFAKQYEAAMLIEPTETESLPSLDSMIEKFRKVAREAAVAPYMIETAPHTTAVAKIIKDQAAYISLLEATTP